MKAEEGRIPSDRFPGSRIPKVGIGMPVYNGEKYIRQAIDSLLAQTFTDFELFVSDNHSTDSTPEILQEYASKDPRVVVHRQPENIGAEGNFKFVICEARAQYYMWAAYDDHWAPNFLEELVGLLDANPSANLAGFRTITFDNDGVILDHSFPDGIAELSVFERVKRVHLEAMKGGWFYGLYRREPLLAALPRTMEIGPIMSGDFLLKISFVYNDSVVGTNAAAFHQRVTRISQAIYQPKSLGSRLDYARRMLVIGRNVLMESAPVVQGKLNGMQAASIYKDYVKLVLKLTIAESKLYWFLIRARARMLKR